MLTPRDILDFWFGDAQDDAECAAQQSKRWWQKDERADCDIAARFGEALDLAVSGEYLQWSFEAESRLALIILFDQFSRNIYRDTRRAYEQDAVALKLCEGGLACGHDMELRLIHRVFFYLPLEHAESLEAQAYCVELYGALLAAADDALKSTFEGYVDYAKKHYDVIEQFGRFPHRNAILGRESTPGELEYLAQPGAGF